MEVAIHRVIKITTQVTHASGSPTVWRTITVTDSDGVQSEITLFAYNSSADLLIEEISS